MSQEIGLNYEQMDLLPQSIEDGVPRDHPARFIREFVDALDLVELGLAERKSEEGRPPYANDLMLKVWLYGYLARIRARREWERACREHLSLLWLTGRHAPDHNTLWRFWQENRSALRKVFRAGVKVAAEQDEGGEYRLPEGLREAEKLRAAILDSLAKMRWAERAHLHPQEPEARLMPCEGRQDPAYNAQAVVDAQAGIIVAAEAVQDESDFSQLVPMLKEVQANLGAVAKDTVADGGYSSGEQWEEAQARGYEVLVAPGAETGGPKRGDYDSTEFAYEAEGDAVICPQGQRLRFAGGKSKGRQRPTVRLYQWQHYQDCPVRAMCSPRRDGRRIELSPQSSAWLRQRAKLQDPVQQALLRRRKAIVEPVFATLK